MTGVSSSGRVLRIGRGLLALLYLGLLLASLEIALRGVYLWKAWQAGRFQDSNAFVAQAMKESDDSLWLVPWQQYRPNARLDHVLPSGERYSVTINNHGFRTRDFSSKSPGVIRILAIGASTTFQGVANNVTYPALLEQYLSDAFPERSIEVFNLGISGSRAGYWTSRMDQLLSYQPDIVIQYNAINDLSRPLYYQQHYGDDGIPWYFSSYLYQYLFPVDVRQYTDVYDVPLQRFRLIRDRLQAAGVHYVTSTFAVPRPETAQAAFGHYLDFNTAFPWGTPLGLHEYDDLHRLMTEYNRHALQFFEREGMHHARMDLAVNDARYFMDACHMNQEGIALQAQAFVPVVSAMIGSMPVP